ncbi:LacI family DNA-binding transcriptional regulator [Pseudomonas japonica]|uniref:LacI family DNA-binding transcriptional regulator n=1 Tax=Pseudomonas japonica TaxID=256466 RepID=UPI0015E3B011|nr:substrate-binding domain-containing protein [Pseudomonas japonica]MBA1289200.1 substrate-binding domain-containing protein [Pseudomonas japonica]
MLKIEKPKLRDVAKLAGVSLGSASRAISSPTLVKPATLAKVEAAVQALGYVRDGAARALALRRTFSVAAIFPTLNNPIYADSIQALQQRLNSHDYQLLIASHEYDRRRELVSVRNFIDRGVEGVLLVGTDHDPAVFEALRLAQRPYVLMWSVDDAADHYCVGFSNEQGGAQVARHLLTLGHQHLAVVTGARAHNERARWRVQGVRNALQAARLDLPESHVIEQPFTLDGGRVGLRQALALHPRPTALVCTTDLLSLGACDEARRQGIAIPAQLSVTGFDNIDFAAVATPPLTSVSVPIETIGHLSADTLIAQIEGRSPARLVALETELVVRGSTGRVVEGGK